MLILVILIYTPGFEEAIHLDGNSEIFKNKKLFCTPRFVEIGAFCPIIIIITINIIS